ncbi:MAG: hypothetical protein NT001_00170 [Candidatus Woesearchaeota archaeon]|nr:hypothetical protein [Candidatus Woesearchaeota archaeon]
MPPKDMDNPNADEVEKAPQIAGIYGGNKFELSTTLIGEFNMSFVNRMTVQIEDDAGYVASRRLSVIADLQAPYVVGTEVK